MLEHVNHPFICNLRYSFQDVEYMYDLPLPNPRGQSAGTLLTRCNQVSRRGLDERRRLAVPYIEKDFH